MREDDERAAWYDASKRRIFRRCPKELGLWTSIARRPTCRPMPAQY